MATDTPNFLRSAFFNAYNLTLLGSSAVATWATREWWVGLVAIASEALWLTWGPSLPSFQRAVRDGERKDQEEAEEKLVERYARQLPEREWTRARSLDAMRSELEADLGANPTFRALMLGSEVEKLKSLVRSFVRLAWNARRAETYSQRVDIAELKRQVQGQRDLAERAADPEVRAIAAKNAEVLEKRTAARLEIETFLAKAWGQMNLIENTVRLLRDQALTMTSPDQLTDQLDDLMNGVEAVQQSARETETLLEAAPERIAEVTIGDANAGSQRVRG